VSHRLRLAVLTFGVAAVAVVVNLTVLR